MATQVNEKLALYPIEAWGVNNYGVKLHINPSWGIQLNDGISLDVEDDEQGNFVGLGVYDPKTNCCYYWSKLENIPIWMRNEPWSAFIAHNGVSDIYKMQKWGLKVNQEHLMWDTQLMSHIIDSSRKNYGLKNLAKEDLNITYPSYEDIVGKKTKKQPHPRKTLDKQPLELVANYNAMDCYTTYKLYEKQYIQSRRISGVSGLPKESDKQVVYFNDIEQSLAPILYGMSKRGVRVDLQYLQGLKQELEAQKAPIETAIKNELGNINLNSPKQLLEALHAKEIYPELKGKPSTDKRALGAVVKNSVVQHLLNYSELDTLLSSFVYPYLDRNQEVVHPFFNQCGTRTGRLSCSNPNLQQIPRKTENGQRVRRMFIPRQGMIMGKADYGQIDLRAMAHLSKDKDMCDMFNSGESIHKFTQRHMNLGGTIGEGPEYDKAKVFNLSVSYFATPFSVSSQLKCSWEEAEKQMEIWWNMFPGLRRWGEKLIFDSTKSGFCTTLCGRRIKIEGLDSTEYKIDRRTGRKIFWKKEAAKRQLMNNLCQGSAQEIIKLAMIKIQKEINEAAGFNPLFGLLIQTHDDLVFESPDIEDVDLVRRCMESAIKLDVPLAVEAKSGPNWADVKEIK